MPKPQPSVVRPETTSRAMVLPLSDCGRGIRGRAVAGSAVGRSLAVGRGAGRSRAAVAWAGYCCAVGVRLAGAGGAGVGVLRRRRRAGAGGGAAYGFCGAAPGGRTVAGWPRRPTGGAGAGGGQRAAGRDGGTGGASCRSGWCSVGDGVVADEPASPDVERRVAGSAGAGRWAPWGRGTRGSRRCVGVSLMRASLRASPAFGCKSNPPPAGCPVAESGNGRIRA